VALAQTGGLLLARVGSLFMTAPAFSHKHIPMQIRVALAFAFTVIFFFTVPALQAPLATSQLLKSLFIQVALGFMQGLAFAIILMTLVAAGDLVDMQMGYAFASFVDPGADSTPHAIFSRLFQIVGLLVFLAVGGHLWLLGTMISSLQATPLENAALSANLAETVITQGSRVLTDAFRLAAPIIAFLALVDVLGMVMAKSVPQLQVMSVAFPFKIIVGLIGAVWFVPGIVDAVIAALERLFTQVGGGF